MIHSSAEVVGACPSCGAVNDDGAPTCVACGAGLGVRLCARCATRLHPNSRFCHWCAAPVGHAGQVGIGDLATFDQRRLVTALFVDLTGSTDMGEHLDPEQLREVMQDYYSAMREEIEAEGGTVSVFVGDAVMAIYGVPIAHEDDPARAMRTGLRLHKRLELLNQGLAHLDSVRLDVRVGIHSGEIVFGQHLTPGDPRLGQLTGDALNTAARLEAAAKPGQVIVSERTARAARGFELREIGPLQLKGKRNPVLAFEVLSDDQTSSAGPNHEHFNLVSTAGGDRSNAMVGRQQELQLLHGLYHQVRSESQPQLATLIGDAGVGKSRLIQEFMKSAVADDPGVALLHGRCLPPGQGISYWPLAEILRSRAGVLIDDAAQVARDKIGEACRALLAGVGSADPDRVAAALCFTIGLEGGDDIFSHMDPRQVRLETFHAWRAFFRGMAGDAPAVVKIEDLHNGAQALVELLEDLVEHGEGAILYLCSARSEIHTRIADWCSPRPRHSCMELAPLSAEDSTAVIENVLGPSDLPPALTRRMAERAEGNPFFLEEITLHLVDEKHLVQRDGVWVLAVEVDEAAIPDTVQMALASRIDLLGAEEKTVLQVASVVGRDFWPGPVAHLLGREMEAVKLVLESLIQAAMVSPLARSSVHGEPEYSFKHMLTRDVAYQTLPRKQRTSAHIGVADWISDRFSEARLEMAEILAYHYGTAYGAVSQERRVDPADLENLRQKAFDSTLLAAEQTGSRWVVDAAQKLATNALELSRQPVERARSLEALGRARWMAQDGDGAWESWTEAADMRIRDVPDDPAAVARLCGRALESVTRWIGHVARPIDPDLAATYLEIGMAHAEGATEERVRLLTAAALWPFAFPARARDGDAQQRAMEAGEEAVAIAGGLGRDDLVSAALDAICNIHFVRGHYGPAMKVIERRLELVDRLQDQQEVADTLNMAATAAFNIGLYEEASEYGSRSVEAAGDSAFFATQAIAWRGLADYRLGRWTDLIADVDRTRQLLGSQWVKPPQPASQHLIAAALVHDIQGNQDAADSLMERMDWGIIESLGRPSAMKAPLVALLMSRRGRFKDARAILEHPDWLIRCENRGVLLEARCELVAAEAAWEEVERLATEATAFASIAGLRALVAHVERLRGRAALGRGDAIEAELRLDAARSGFAATGARWERACTEVDLAQALLLRRQASRARGLLKSAEAELAELRSLREIARCRELLRQAHG